MSRLTRPHRTTPLQSIRQNCFETVPLSDWQVYRDTLEALDRAGIAVALGGGVAYGAYAARSRYTKDLDLYLCADQVEQAVGVMTSLGFQDYFDQRPYQRHWIYRGIRDGLILDIIWRMANDRAEVTEQWLSRGPEVAIHGFRCRLIPPEEMIWLKLYVMQRERLDWPDVWNILAYSGKQLDWNHLIQSLGADLPLLASAVQVFCWLFPHRARQFPASIWELLGIQPPETPWDIRRAALLDTRDWFGDDEPVAQ